MFPCKTEFHRNFNNLVRANIEIRLCQDEHRDGNYEGVFLTNIDLYVY